MAASRYAAAKSTRVCHSSGIMSAGGREARLAAMGFGCRGRSASFSAMTLSLLVAGSDLFCVGPAAPLDRAMPRKLLNERHHHRPGPAWLQARRGTLMSGQLPHLRLRLLQPVRHVHLAVHRRCGREVFAGLLALACAPVELAEAEG